MDLELEVTGSLTTLYGSRFSRMLEKLSTKKRIEKFHLNFSCFDRNAAFWSENFATPLDNFMHLTELKLAFLNFNDNPTILKVLRKVVIRLTKLELEKIKDFFE